MQSCFLYIVLSSVQPILQTAVLYRLNEYQYVICKALDTFIQLQQFCSLCHCVCCFFCLHKLWTSSSDDNKLINRSNSLFIRLFSFLCVSVIECWPLPDTEPLMHGEVQSPQYPQPYPPNLQEQWDLSVPEGYQIRLTFTHLDIEASAGCHYDALTVRATFQHI